LEYLGPPEDALDTELVFAGGDISLDKYKFYVDFSLHANGADLFWLCNLLGLLLH
jgi:hypothetical protein